MGNSLVPFQGKQSEVNKLSLGVIDISSKVNFPIQIVEEPIFRAKKIMDLLNPFNFLKWILYALKDVY